MRFIEGTLSHCMPGVSDHDGIRLAKDPFLVLVGMCPVGRRMGLSVV